MAESPTVARAILITLLPTHTMTTPKRNSDDSIIKETDNKQTQEEPTLAQILDQMSKLVLENELKNKEIEALKKSVDITTYNNALSEQSKDDRRTVRLVMVEGKPLKSWSDMIIDEVVVDGGKIIENQKCRIEFLDGTTKEVLYTTAFNHINRTERLPINAITEKNGKTYYEIEYEGETHQIEKTFIN